MSAVEAVVARLAGRVDGWKVYAHGVPDGNLPARYIAVYGAPGRDEPMVVADLHDMREPVVWVLSACRHSNASFAASEANAASVRVRDALRDWRPDLGRANWKCLNQLSRVAARDESLPETYYVASEQFTLLHQV